MVEAALGIVVGGLVLALAVVVIRFNRKRTHIIRAAARASDEQLESVYRLVEACGAEKPAGCILGRTNRRVADTSCAIAIPEWLEDFPWAGRSIAVTAGQEVAFRFAPDQAAAIQSLGRVHRAVAVPRTKLKSGKARNMFSPDRYVSSSDALLRSLREICPRYPNELLAYLLCIGGATFEFDPIDQARIATSPAWVQDAEFPSCDECKGRMTLILQLPGTMVAKKGFGAGTCYLFGCRQHPERTKTVVQFS